MGASIAGACLWFVTCPFSAAHADWQRPRAAPETVADLAGWSGGGAVLAYIEEGTTHLARTDRVGRLGAGRPLPSADPAEYLRLRVGAAGDVAVDWEEIEPGCTQSLCSTRPVVARWPRGRALTPGEPLSDFGEVGDLALAINERGRYLGLFRDYNSGLRLATATRSSPFVKRAGPAEDAAATEAASLPDGRFRLTWAAEGGWMEAYADRDGNLGPARSVATNFARRGRTTIFGHLFSNARGDQLVTWRERGPGDREVTRAAFRDPPGSFLSHQTLGAGVDVFLGLAFGGRSRALVAQARRSRGQLELMVRLRERGARFGRWRRLSRKGPGGAEAVGQAIDGRNNALVVWREPLAGRLAIRAAVARAGRGFGRPRTLYRITRRRGRPERCDQTTAVAAARGGFTVLVSCDWQGSRFVTWTP